MAKFATPCTLLGFQFGEDLLFVFFSVIGLLEKKDSYPLFSSNILIG